MLDVEGFILVGGASSRMGSDKSRMLLAGRSTLEVITHALQPVTKRVRLVGVTTADDSSPEYVADLRNGWGPLAGIEAALQSWESEWSIMVACDLPFGTAKLFERLLGETRQSDATVPIQDDSRPQPLCAAYRRATCLPAAMAAIDAGKHAPRALLDAVDTQYVRFEQLSDLAGSEY